ncbi:xylanase deacetylase [Paenibacillus yonginensis]|uniref:Xylanase deacetylase n=1 Tax=Paenibacillus yonginensis TaxID=1462996 RepID=A0A1B1N1Z1_9BACL|nr:polysaccharide deacetylase family protein [Paenibacillus yonginensis]ANS75426.1 xylanase deacetylase [Paenibacillus yonginensis]
METLLLGLFYIFSLYAFIPGLISRLFGFRVFKKGIAENEIALTFDDGPDPVYTPQLLELLKRYDAKATFFVVGSSAEKHPELIQRVHEEGHLLGIHNYKHKTNWLMRPKTVTKHIAMTAKVIKEATGQDAHYYRPPWGIVNLFDYTKQRNDYQLVLWSAIFRDWRVNVGADRLTEKMLKKLRGGEVFLLHDCGGTFGANPTAPQEMLTALERVLDEAQRRGIRSITIQDMIQHTAQAKNDSLSEASKKLGVGKGGNPVLPWYKRFIVSLWLLWEKLFHVMFHLQTTDNEDPMFHFRKIKYSGAPIELEGGGTLAKGDPVLELHFDNKKLFQLGSKAKSAVHLAIQLVRTTEKALPDLARYIQKHPELREVKALYGITMINRGPEQFGFTITDLPKGLFATSTTFYLKLLMSVIHPNGRERIKAHQEQMVPKILVIPTENLISRFAGEEPVPASKPAAASVQLSKERQTEDKSSEETAELNAGVPV